MRLFGPTIKARNNVSDYFVVDVHHGYAETMRRAFEKHPDWFDLWFEIKFQNTRMVELVDLITQTVGLQRVKTEMFGSHELLLTFTGDVIVSFSFQDKAPDGQASFAKGHVIAPPEQAVEIRDKLRTKFFSPPSQKAEWYYQTAQGRIDSTTVDLNYGQTVQDAFYPFISEGLDSYFARYVEDNANVLILLGEPGTGKTTFVREMIHRQNMSTMVTHDAELMNKDELFISFIGGDEDLLVLEDSDVMIASRMDGNHIMAKLLNAADGLIRTRKKMVLTANLAHVEEIDTALIRPGRCFGVVKFRELTRSEATAAAAAAGLPDPGEPVTLANLFKGPSPIQEKKTGF
jgi:hypothetical protein